MHPHPGLSRWKWGLVTSTHRTFFLPSHLFFLPPYRRQKEQMGRMGVDEFVLVVKPISTGTSPDGVQLSPTFDYWNWWQMIIPAFASANSVGRKNLGILKVPRLTPSECVIGFIM